MKISPVTLTHKQLTDRLNYDRDTGVFTYKVRVSQAKKAGDIAGYETSNGYWNIGIMGQYHCAHRLAWFYVTGEWSIDDIDHKNGVRKDNSFDNLREVNRSVNCQNRNNVNSNNKLGITGVHKQRNAFIATIRYGGRQRYLGSFGTKELAHNAYMEAKRAFHEGYIACQPTQ